MGGKPKNEPFFCCSDDHAVEQLKSAIHMLEEDEKEEKLELIEAVEKFVKDELKNVDSSHDWNHINRVRSNAMKILEAEQIENRFMNADAHVIEIAALMHDIGDFKYTKDHSAGPKMVKKFLGTYLHKGITEKQIEKISSIVENISFRHELSHGMSSDLPEELLIVQDADRLDAIGAIGIARCFAYSGAMKHPFYTESDRQIKFDITAEEYDEQTKTGGGSAIGHFYEKLFKLKELMKTETGKKMAQERDKFMKEFIDYLRKECNL